MKSTIFLLVVLTSFICTPSIAQKTKKQKLFRAWLKSGSGDNIEGLQGPAYLLELKDSSLVFAYLVGTKTSTFLTKEYEVSEISILKFRKEKLIRKGILISGLSGFALGGLWGKVQDQITPLAPKTTGKEILAYGAVLGISTATLIGIALSIKSKVVINGDQATYERKKHTLQKFLIKLEIPAESK